MADLSGGRDLANQIARAMEGRGAAARAWIPVWMPDGERGLVAFGGNTTVATVNARLAQVFGHRVYFLGYRVVTGLVISARLTLTMDQLDAMDVQPGVGTFSGDWFGE